MTNTACDLVTQTTRQGGQGRVRYMFCSVNTYERYVVMCP